MGVGIRVARVDELASLVAIELTADARFASVGIDLPATAPCGADAAAQASGRILVAELADGSLAGFVRIEIVDAAAHVEQVSVLPEHSRQGVGRALLDAAEDWARRRGHSRITLTTYRDVPWNGPFYRRLGWTPLADADLGPELAALRARERADGLDVRVRQAMVKRLGPG